MSGQMDINRIMEVLPHRYPMLLVDRILECDAGKSCRGLKNVTINEAFFQGHYPDQPIMPGVLILEAMAQAGAVILLSEDKYKGLMPVIGAIDDVKYRKPVVPGDQLILDVELLWVRQNIGRIKAEASVDDELVASMMMTFKLLERE
ncbi:MAG: 3-hydroxyacyl-ACP dehydratase FabZ [Armatimonadetes bacterium]|nr:3-hydroxyacyl-ACP dehydratase FabZ [Armatimonadota bacterium]